MAARPIMSDGMSIFPKRLLEGYQSFMDGRYTAERQRYRDLAESGQEPHTLVIACCDSRAAPETIFDCGPGELWVMDTKTGDFVRPDPGLA